MPSLLDLGPFRVRFEVSGIFFSCFRVSISGSGLIAAMLDFRHSAFRASASRVGLGFGVKGLGFTA